jgi:dUTP pyrophosphatase
MIVEIKYTNKNAELMYTGGDIYGSKMAAAFDLKANIDAPMTILTGEQAFIPTGIMLNMAVEQEWNGTNPFAAVILPRSGRGSKEGLVLANTSGLIDQDYQGEIIVCAWARPTSGYVDKLSSRMSSSPVFIKPGDRIAQLMFVPIIRPTFVVAHEFSDQTTRGANGFGSTGN